MRFLKPHVLPGLATVSGLVNTIAPERTALIVCFTGTDPNRFRVLRIQSDVSDGCRGLAFENAIPSRAIVFSFPKSASGTGHKDVMRVVGIDLDISHAATGCSWAYLSPRKLLEPVT